MDNSSVSEWRLRCQFQGVERRFLLQSDVMMVLGPFQPACSLEGKKNPKCSSRTQELDVAAENVARGGTAAKKSSMEEGSGSEVLKRLSEVPG